MIINMAFFLFKLESILLTTYSQPLPILSFEQVVSNI